VKEVLAGKEPIAKKTLYVSTKSTGAFFFAPVMDFTSRPPLQLHLIQDGKLLLTLPPLQRTSAGLSCASRASCSRT
jgi:hypothetical protein